MRGHELPHLVATAQGIHEAQSELVARLNEVLPRTVRHVFGHLGKSFNQQVRTNDRLWYHHGLAGETEPNRFWNAFGLFSRPDPGNIVVEINLPLSGRDTTIAGAIARDEDGALLTVAPREGRRREGRDWTRSVHRLVQAQIPCSLDPIRRC